MLIDWLKERKIPVVLAITKIDKLKPMRRAARMRELKKTICLPKESVVTTSAQDKTGIEELWKAMDAGVAPG